MSNPQARDAILKAVAAAKDRIAAASPAEWREITQVAATDAALDELRRFARSWWCYREARALLRYALPEAGLSREDGALIDALIRRV